MNDSEILAPIILLPTVPQQPCSLSFECRVHMKTLWVWCFSHTDTSLPSSLSLHPCSYLSVPLDHYNQRKTATYIVWFQRERRSKYMYKFWEVAENQKCSKAERQLKKMLADLKAVIQCPQTCVTDKRYRVKHTHTPDWEEELRTLPMWRYVPLLSLQKDSISRNL